MIASQILLLRFVELGAYLVRVAFKVELEIRLREVVPLHVKERLLLLRADLKVMGFDGGDKVFVGRLDGLALVLLWELALVHGHESKLVALTQLDGRLLGGDVMEGRLLCAVRGYATRVVRVLTGVLLVLGQLSANAEIGHLVPQCRV